MIEDSSYTYLDYAASTPLRDVARTAYLEYLMRPYACANTSSVHSWGRKADLALNQARRRIAVSLGGKFKPQEVIFCSGGTEANLLAVKGIAEAAHRADARKSTVVISALEHKSITALQPILEACGLEVRILLPNAQGFLEPEALGNLMDSSVSLVSCMAANNETGLVQPIEALARIAHEHGSFFHTDAAQALGKIPLDLNCCDAVSVCGHKIGAPLGIGALLIRNHCRLTPQQRGGAQEQGRRAGTSAVALAQSFAETVAYVSQHQCDIAEGARAIQQILLAELTSCPYITALADSEAFQRGKVLPTTLALCLQHKTSAEAVLALDNLGFAISGGSACSSTSTDLSPVLAAMNYDAEARGGVVRISFDERVEHTAIKACASALMSLYTSTPHSIQRG